MAHKELSTIAATAAATAARAEYEALVWMQNAGGALWLVELADAGYGDPITRSLVRRGLIWRQVDPWGRIIFHLTDKGWELPGGRPHG